MCRHLLAIMIIEGHQLQEIMGCVNWFTRIAGETFGMLIAVLFIQEAIKGLVSEFKVPKNEDPNREKCQFQWLYTNGLLAIVFSFGLLYTALKSRKARSWWYGTGKIRSFIADYGVPLLVVAWTALSFSVPSNIPSGVPRRLYSPLLWESESTTIGPLSLIWVRFLQRTSLAQQKEFNLKNTSAYHYDILLLGFMQTLAVTCWRRYGGASKSNMSRTGA